MVRNFTSYRKLLFVSILALPLLSACGPAKWQEPQSKRIQDLPEAHGPMKFDRVTRPYTDYRYNEDEISRPIGMPGTQSQAGSLPPDTQVENCEGENCLSSAPESSSDVVLPIDTEPATSAKRKLICEDAHTSGDRQTENGVSCPGCFKGQFTQNPPPQVKLDILFVADTSPTLETPRAAIANGIRQFIEQLPKDTDYRIAVMAAHSDESYDSKKKSSTGKAGRLVVVGNEPAVLKKSDYGDRKKLSRALTTKLMKMKSDAASDGGELGLYSLDKGISEPLLSKNKELGFFRQEAALAVVFISDENDICSYGVNYPAGVVPKVNVNKYKDDNGVEMTVEEKANRFYCQDDSGQPTVSSRSVYMKLRELKKAATGEKDVALPLILSGILYTEEANVPLVPTADEKYPQYFGEKEVGYGYLDIIKDNNGIAVDLSKKDFDEGLRQIGQTAALKLEVKTEFPLKQGEEVDPNTVCVLVDGKEVPQVQDFETRIDGMSYLYRSDLREVQVRGIGATNRRGRPSNVEVFYCEPYDMMYIPPEVVSRADAPTRAQHYRNLPIPAACKTVRAKIEAGVLDQKK